MSNNEYPKDFSLAELTGAINEYFHRPGVRKEFEDLEPINYRWVDEDGRQCSAWKIGDLMTGDGGKAMYDDMLRKKVNEIANNWTTSHSGENRYKVTSDSRLMDSRAAISIESAMNVIVGELVQNVEYREAWKSTLVLSFRDELLNSDEGKLLNPITINELAKKGADKFLNIITAKVNTDVQ